ncbi:unnamed protein product [Urochloa decumbens]|uniref:DUF4220 domain-containing protein n=1 Tax=Urochloa decumbens TaxID=240449 RepID=A0ABC9GK72_9POAL
MGRVSEVQLLVLLSFILQLFLFFTGGLRRRARNWLLRGTIWLAYMGADVVAIYALGFLSRHGDAMRSSHDDASLRLAHPLAFLWAPFLLIHLGGQDTITAFAIEDNNLWLRHLLNLLLQVTLALYVFWKSSGWHSTQVLVPGVLVFVAGIIKYAERTAAMWHGNLKNISTSKSTTNNSNDNSNNTSSSSWDHNGRDQQNPVTVTSIVCCALRSAPGIRMLFARRKTPKMASDLLKITPSDLLPSNSHKDLFRLMDAELGIMYSDVYTKAAVLRTGSGIAFRCISLACTVAALVLFFFFGSRADHDTTNTYTASRVDTIITCTLFIGGLVVDVCSLLTMVMASPWTWAWLRARAHRRIAAMCLRLVTVSGWLGTTRPLWSNTMGQYRFVCYENDSRPWPSSSSPPPPTRSERVMGVIRKLVSSEEMKNQFCLSKLLETKHVEVDDSVTECLVEAIDDIVHSNAEQWGCLGQMLLAVTTRTELTCDFVRLVSWLHACTEVLLCEAQAEAEAAEEEAVRARAQPDANAAAAAAASADVCRKLSRYMVYLVAVHPAGADLVQVVCGHPNKEYESWERYSTISLGGKRHQVRMGLLRLELEAARRDCGCASSCAPTSPRSRRILASSLPPPEKWKETLEKLKRMWARLLVYAAAKSRPEAHAAELARGGELLTFVWLLLSHNGLGATFWVDLVPQRSKHQASSEPESGGAGSSKTYYVFKNLPPFQVVVDNCCPQLLLPPQQPNTNTDSSRIPPVMLAPSRVNP